MSVSRSGAPGRTRTGTPQSCRLTWQAGCSTPSSQLAACAVTCSTPSGTSSARTSCRVSATESPAPSRSSSGGDALTCSRVDGP